MAGGWLIKEQMRFQKKKIPDACRVGFIELFGEAGRILQPYLIDKFQICNS